MTSAALELASELVETISRREAADPETFPAENVADVKRARLHAAPFTRELGGLDASLAECVAVTERIAMSSASTALLLAMPLGLAAIYATPYEAPSAHVRTWREQRERIARDYQAGRWYAACNSEKGAGGSLAATQTVARRGDDGLFRLSGEKILASGGRFADVFFSTAKVDASELPGAGIVEFFFVDTGSPGVEVLDDWDGFGMRSTESQTVRYSNAPARELMGFPDFLAAMQPLQCFYCLFAAIPLGCAAMMLHSLSNPAPAGPALRARLSEAQMRYEAMRAYLLETAGAWRGAAGAEYANRVLRCKTYVTQEATKLCAELFALSGGRNYRRSSAVARALADSFAGTALRPPLPLALETLAEQFEFDAATVP
jgi:alkylation response protein AidB-like acyl-CoA dehydrogenase